MRKNAATTTTTTTTTATAAAAAAGDEKDDNRRATTDYDERMQDGVEKVQRYFLRNNGIALEGFHNGTEAH